MSASPDREILNIEEAAALLGVSVKTFNKVLHSEDLPARKIGREWKFSRQALIDWIGHGHSRDFYREGGEAREGAQDRSRQATSSASGSGDSGDRRERAPDGREGDRGGMGRRTAGWRIEVD